MLDLIERSPTEPEAAFALAYFSGPTVRNGTRSYLKVFPHVEYDTARCECVKYLARPSVKAMLADLAREQGLTPELVRDTIVNELRRPIRRTETRVYDEAGMLKRKFVTETDRELKDDARLAAEILGMLDNDKQTGVTVVFNVGNGLDAGLDDAITVKATK
jgi:hypothetical protein